MYVLIGCLVRVTLRPARTGGWPVAIASISVVIVLMLLLKPGTGTPVPSLTPAGDAALGTAIATALLGIAHTVELRRYFRPTRLPARTPPRS